MSALRRVEPALAEQLEKDADTSCRSAIPTITRDKGLNFRIPLPDGQTVWFGRTSIPKVRAEAMLARFQAGSANVLLPGIGEGTEVYLLTQRLGRHRAVFVWEEDTTSIRLVLRLHDLAEAIEHQRVVFIPCPLEKLTSTLVDWLVDHCGHLCPNRIMLWPWHRMADLASCQAAVEAAFGRIEQTRREALKEITEQLAKADSLKSGTPAEGRKTTVGGAVSTERRIDLFSLHALDATWALTKALSAGASALGWDSLAIDLRTPADVHPLSRAGKLARAPGGLPDSAILLEVTRKEVRDVLPDTVPTVCWLGRQAMMDANLPNRFSGQEVMATTNGWLLDRIGGYGLDPRRLFVCPLPALSCSEPVDFVETEERPINVCILADLSPTDAGSFGHQLDTHCKIWNAAVDLLKARIERFTDAQFDELLARAEAKVKACVEGEKLRSAISDALGLVVAPNLLWQFLAQTLVNNNITVDVYGNGWADVPGVRWGGRAPTIAQKIDILRKAKIVVYAEVTGAVTLDALLAAGSGPVLVARAHPRDLQPGGLKTMFEPGEEIVFFDYVRELSKAVRGLLKDDRRRRQISQKARLRCVAEHSPAKRLQTLQAAATSDFMNSPA